MKKTIEFTDVDELLKKARLLQEMYEYGRSNFPIKVYTNTFYPVGDTSFIATVDDAKKYESEIKEYREYIDQVNAVFKVKVIENDKGEA